ncbi:hypothetical protein BCU83_04200 [Vibrio breoganii]|uniref:DUF2787 family protein n=1 Tax=Vibrio breoganii TaxID=553239 RepID=UPI000CA8B918|nr:DUF2787 family protein [Vibrio breoganii]PMG86419.1 hypothetical protein BCU83_04200 [Vibrio breoganii]
MNISLHPNIMLPNESLTPLLNHALAGESPMSSFKRLSLNIRSHAFIRTKQGQPPVELHLERSALNSDWKIVVIACFGFIEEHSDKLDVELYFNLKRGWIYHPFTQDCNLLEPPCLSLLESFVKALSIRIQTQQFDEITLTPIVRFS